MTTPGNLAQKAGFEKTQHLDPSAELDPAQARPTVTKKGVGVGGVSCPKEWVRRGTVSARH